MHWAPNVAGMVSSNDKLKQKILEASRRTTEELWELPLNEGLYGYDKIKCGRHEKHWNW